MDVRRQAAELVARAGTLMQRLQSAGAEAIVYVATSLRRLAGRQALVLQLAWKRCRRVGVKAATFLGARLGRSLRAMRARLSRSNAWLAGAARSLADRRAVALRAASAATRPVRLRWAGLRQRLDGLGSPERSGMAAALRLRLLEPALTHFMRWRGSDVRSANARYRVEVSALGSRRVAVGAALLFAILLVLPGFAERDLINDLIFLFTMLALAQYWNLLAGYAGLVSIGQQAFVGLGGYLLFALTIHAGIDPLLAILLAGAVAGLLALPTALVVFRLRGAYFAIGTWVVAEVYRLVFAQFRQLGGGTGTSLSSFVTNEVAGIQWVKAAFDIRTSAARDIITYWTALLLTAATILIVYLVLRSRHGLALAAIRDSETAAEGVGVDSFRTKLQVYIVTAFGTGMVGALIYLQKARISPDAAFSVLDWTAYVIFIVVIGGIGTIEGPIIGVLVFYLLQTQLAHFGSWYLILLGMLAIFVMLFAPKGIWGYISERYRLALFPLRRLLHANSPRDAQTSG